MLERKVAFVTGAASGIGKETVRRFSDNSQYNPIYAADLDPNIASTFDHPHIIPLELDVRSFRQVDRALQRITDEAGRIDLIVNAAGTIAASKVQRDRYESPVDQRMHISMLQTNDESVRYIMDQALKIMRTTGGGTIINITSSKDHFPDPYRREYERSKRRIEVYSLRKAEEYAQQNVRVVVVKPGNTKTNIDRGSWITHDSQTEMLRVQNFNDWWRKTFGNDPKNVAEVIYRIGEGEISGNKVFVGLDAKLGQFLVKVVPGWRHIFYVGSSAAYAGVRMLGKLRGYQDSSTNHATPNNLSGEWFEEGVVREAETSVARDIQVVKADDRIYTRTMNSDSQGGHFEGYLVDVNKIKELGISAADLGKYLDFKAEELGNSTMLLESCEPEPDGDWKYKYVADKAGEHAAFGTITVSFKGEVVFNHYISVSRVN